MRRLSISIPSRVEEAIRAAAGAAGLLVSVWLARAAERAAAEQAALADGLAAVAEFEADEGALTDAERADARQVLIVARLLRGCQVTPDIEDLGKAAGAICGRAGTTDVIDALVVATALRVSALVVTSDPDDLQRLASSIRSKLALYRV